MPAAPATFTLALSEAPKFSEALARAAPTGSKQPTAFALSSPGSATSAR